MKKSKFSVTPYHFDSGASTLSESQENQSIKSHKNKRQPLAVRESLIQGLDRIQEDIFGGEAESRSELPPLIHHRSVVPQQSMISERDMNARHTERNSRSLGKMVKPLFKMSRPSAFEGMDEYYPKNNENGRTQSRSTISSGDVISSIALHKEVPGPDISPVDRMQAEDVYQLFRSMENNLDKLRKVIQVQKGRLNTAAVKMDSVIQSNPRFSRHESKLMRASRSQYLRR